VADPQPRVERVLDRLPDHRAAEDDEGDRDPGGTIAHQASTVIALCEKAFSISFPHEVSVGSPRPRNAIAVSAKIAIATVSTVLATRSGITCGRTWRKTMRPWLAPIAFARFT
jgi:hypothetical protein